MRDYAKDLREEAPEGLIEWVKENRLIKSEYLIYRAGRRVDLLSGEKTKCVDAHCTACGRDMELDYAAGCTCHGYGSPFGFGIEEGGQRNLYGSGNVLLCPCCGGEVKARHIGDISRKIEDTTWVMTLDTLPEAGKADRLVLYLWYIRRRYDKEGHATWSAQPYEAYVTEEKTMRRCSHWICGGFGQHHITPYWEQRTGFYDGMYDIEHVYCPGGIESVTEGTVAENARLAEYMAIRRKRYPVSWLRLWQKRHSVETVFSVGAGELVGEMIQREKETTQYNSYTGAAMANRSVAWLKGLDWTQKRPAGLLRMNAGELRGFLAFGGNARDWEKISTLRQAGERIDIPEDMTALRAVDTNDIRSLSEWGADWKKAGRYLSEQKKRYPGAKPDVKLLTDYYAMCKKVGWSLEDDAVRWPMNLKRAHDQALEHIQFEEQKELQEKFQKRAKALQRFRFAADGLEIAVPERESDLIREGKALHHCVASYARRHAEGEITILFVRRSEDAKTPFYTLSIYEESMTVCMNNGDHNCHQTPEVKVFEELFMEWARSGCPRDKKTGTPIIEKERKTA